MSGPKPADALSDILAGLLDGGKVTVEIRHTHLLDNAGSVPFGGDRPRLAVIWQRGEKPGPYDVGCECPLPDEAAIRDAPEMLRAAFEMATVSMMKLARGARSG